MEERLGGGFRNWYAWDYWQASVINRRVISIRATKGCHAKRPCPTAGETRVSRARVLTPAIISGRGVAGRVGERATVVAGNSRQRRWAGSGIPRRARVSALYTRARKRGRGELSRGRSPTAARTLLLVEEDSPVRGCQHPFFSRPIAQERGGKGGNFRWLGRPGGICLATVPDRVNSTEPNST